MNKKLSIGGAGTYGVVASEIAVDMGYFEKISFVDNEKNDAKWNRSYWSYSRS